MELIESVVDFIDTLIEVIGDLFSYLISFLDTFASDVKAILDDGNIFLGIAVLLLLIKIIGMIKRLF